MRFRVFLDGTQYKGVNTDNLPTEYARADEERGFVTKFSEKVEFYEDAYAYLRGIFFSNPCASVEVLIEISTSSLWETYVEGFLLASRIEIDEKRCVISGPIDANDVDAIFVKYKDFDVDFSSTTTLNGVALSSVQRELHNFLDGGGSVIATTSVDFAKGYRLDEAFDYILQYVTDGRLRFISDFMDTSQTILGNTWRLDFSQTPVNTENVTITQTDEFNNTITAVVTSNGVTADFVQAVRAAINFRSIVAPLGFVAVTSPGTTPAVIRLKSYESNPTLVSVVCSGATTVTLTQEETYVENLANFYISDGYRLTDRNDEPFKLSFTELFKIVTKMRDMSYAIELIGNQYYLRMEPIEYFLSGSLQAEVANVPAVKITAAEENRASSIYVGGLSSSATYVFNTLDCGGTRDERIPDEIHYHLTDFLDQFAFLSGGTDYEGEYFIIKGDGNGGAFDTPISYSGTNTQFGAYNFGLQKQHLLISHLGFLPDYVIVNPKTYNATWLASGSGATLVGASDTAVAKTPTYIGAGLQYLSVAKFTNPLKLSEFNAIGPYGLVPFSNNYGTRYGYILRLKYSPKGLADFELLVQ